MTDGVAELHQPEGDGSVVLVVVGCQGGCGSVKSQVVCGRSSAGLSCPGCMGRASHMSR